MTRKATLVKPKRAYDRSGRQERARQSRQRIIDAAQQRFLLDGYVPTTVTAIAGDAGVSVDTIYKSFGGKPGILRAVYDRGLEGEGAIPAERRSEEVQARESDPRAIITAWGAFVTEVAPRAAPSALLLRNAAATDPEVGELLDDIDARRLHRMTENARRLHGTGGLRAGLTIAQVADVLWTYTAPELYELLVLRRGWRPREYGRFVADAMIGVLL